MNWEALGAIGEIVGAIAVVVTLGYLAMQMRQNTAALQTASRQEIASGFREVNRLVLDPNSARIYATGLHAYPDMPFDERSHYFAVVMDQMLAFQGAYAMYESGQLEEDTYQAYLDWVACHLATPGGAAWWADTGRPYFPKRVVAALDARLAQGDLPDIREVPGFRLDETPPLQATSKRESEVSA